MSKSKSASSEMLGKRLAGKVAVVTGASRGAGRGIALTWMEGSSEVQPVWLIK